MQVGYFLLLLAAVLVARSAATPSINRSLRGTQETEEERVPFSNSVTGLTGKLKKAFATSDKKKLERAAKLVAKRADSQEFAKAKVSPEYMYQAMGLEASLGKYADWQKLSFTEKTQQFYKALGTADQQLARKINQWDGYELAWANGIYNKVYKKKKKGPAFAAK
ncbi:hypothetical protein P3T76_015225 [Phytophthora citrophthora]|uniref:RxLR effector protein n=1 Tax=Phytophthora citrophthora TaxID=4793 RepID=A0AAD9LAF9_9STRA|nr:hypothetical protein P3T76_015222 [Phytophthora citrophthora]KAK1929273.1 hypothetical protein P3T76_015225 [Phytophthora citrophthora]